MSLNHNIFLLRCTGGLYSGAAPLSPDTMEFFKKIGLMVCEIYGECLPYINL